MSKHKDKDKRRSRSRSSSKDKERREKKKSKKSKRSKSRERKHSHRRSRSRSRSSSGERRHRRREERYEREQREEREREEREKEMERDRLRQIALEFKQSGAFSSIATQSQSFQNPFQQNLPTIPLLSSLSSFPTFTSFPMMNTHVAPVVELQPQPQPPKEKSQAFLEAIAASQRIAASKNFNEIFTCSNSNDSTSNGPTYNSGSNSRDEAESAASIRQRKKKSRWGGSEQDKTFIPGMPTVLPPSLDSHQQEAYLVQLQIEEISRKLRTGELGIAPVEERSPSPEPIYSSDGKRLNTREFRTRKKLEEQRHQLILRMQCMNPDFKPPADYKAPIVRVSDKVLIPQEEHPDINFVGLLIGPRGNTLKAMEKETGAKIIIRGKGSVKEGKVGRKDGQPLPGEDEPLHAFITAANADCVKKAVEKINEVIKQGIEVPEGHNDLRRMQLRELAQLNGTLRETEGPRCTNCGSNEHKSWLCPDKPNVTNNIMCSSCGAAGHIAKDCKAKRPGQGGPPVVSANSQAKIDEEYLSLMAELGEGPPASKGKDSDSAQTPPSSSSNRNQFSIFDRNQGPMKAIAAPNPVQPPPPPRMSQPPNWNGQPPMPVPPLPPGGGFAMPPPPIRPPMWNQQPQIPGTDLPPMPPSGNAYPPPPPPGTSNWTAPLPPTPAQQFPWSNGTNFVPPLPAVPPPPPPPPGS